MQLDALAFGLSRLMASCTICALKKNNSFTQRRGVAKSSSRL